jgi:hypothetical protein
MGFSNEELKWIKKMILSRAPNKDTLDKLISLASSKNINSLSLQDISSLKQFLDLLEKDILKQLYTNISPTRKLINIG